MERIIDTSHIVMLKLHGEHKSIPLAHLFAVLHFGRDYRVELPTVLLVSKSSLICYGTYS